MSCDGEMIHLESQKNPRLPPPNDMFNPQLRDNDG